MGDVLYESFENCPALGDSAGGYWIGETFTPLVSHTLKKLGAYLRRKNDSGSFVYKLYATSGGIPTGSALATVTFPATDVPSGALTWVEKTLVTGVPVTSGTMYAFYWYNTATSFYWGRNTSGGYSRGTSIISIGGASWSTQASIDNGFREYAVTAPPTVSSTRLTGSYNALTAVANITDKGGYTVTKRGVAYNTSGGDPDPAVDDKVEETGDFDTGEFSEPITGLTPETKYYVRPYAYSVEEGYGYGTTQEYTLSASFKVWATINGRTAGVAAGTSFAAIRAGGDGLAVLGLTDTNPDNLLIVRDTMTASPWLFRSWLYFDVRGLPSVFARAKLRLYIWDDAQNLKGNTNIHIIKGVQGFEIPTVANWVSENAETGTSYGSKAIQDFTKGQLNDFYLNAAGVAYIKAQIAAGDYAKFCFLTEPDLNDNISGVVHDNNLHAYFVQESGKEPYLELEFAGGNQVIIIP